MQHTPLVMLVCVQPCGKFGTGKWKVEKPHGTKRCPEAGQSLLYQHDGACKHTTKFNGCVFAVLGKGKGFDIQVVVQPGQKTNLNADDLVFFNRLQTDVSLMAKETRK